MRKFIRSAITRRIAAGFTLGAAAMLMIQPPEKAPVVVDGPTPTLAPLV